MNWEPEGFVEATAEKIGRDDAAVKADLERFKELVENRGVESGAWRGQVVEGDRVDKLERASRGRAGLLSISARPQAAGRCYGRIPMRSATATGESRPSGLGNAGTRLIERRSEPQPIWEDRPSHEDQRRVA